MAGINRLNFLSTPRRRTILFTLLYMSEGAPIGFIWWTLPTELRSFGVPIDTITALTSLLVIPWAFKFLWAPLIDIYRTERWKLRSWIIASQIVMGAALVPALFIENASQFPLLFSFFLLHTFAAATQDVSIDALCIAEVEPEERSVLNGWMQAGMLIGRSLFGGGAILVLQYVEMKFVLGALIGLIWATTIVLFFSEQQSSIGTGSINDRRKIFWDVLKQVLSTRTSWLGMLFAVIGGTAYESIGAVAGPFFVDNGFSKDQIGSFFSIFSIAAMLLGALIGGYGGKRFGTKRSAAASLSFIVFMVFTLATYHVFRQIPRDPVYFIILTLIYFGIGMFTASSYALFMNITDARLGATQFSAYMGGTNICESWSGYTAGMLITAAGYSAAFYTMGIISIFSLAILYFISEMNNSDVRLD